VREPAILVMIAFVLSSVACERPRIGLNWLTGARPKPIEARILYPLEQGSHWSYRYRDLLHGDSGSYDFELVSRGACRIAELERDVFVVDESSPTGVSPTGYFFDRDALISVLGLEYLKDGSLRWTASKSSKAMGLATAANTRWVLPRVLRVGDQWKDHAQIQNAVVDSKNRAVAVEDIEVPGGRFHDAYRVDSIVKVSPAEGESGSEGDDGGTDGVAYAYRDWYAPNVGLLRSYVTSEDGTPVADIVLKRFVPASDEKAPNGS
jgi:hypothetical protein